MLPVNSNPSTDLSLTAHDISAMNSVVESVISQTKLVLESDRGRAMVGSVLALYSAGMKDEGRLVAAILEQVRHKK